MISKEEVKNDGQGKESTKRVKLNERVEVRTYRVVPVEPQKKKSIRGQRDPESDFEESSYSGSYSDDYTESEERVKVLSDESSLEDDDFDFLNSEKFFDYV
jgi:hypothetical protein